MIIVAGLARSGLSLTMQMLNAGGFPCVGEYPSFEHYAYGAIRWEECTGKAIKSIDPHRQIPPYDMDYKIIFLRRDMYEQAKSFNKFVQILMGFPRTQDRTSTIMVRFLTLLIEKSTF